MKNKKHLELKLKDYQRFVATLLILSSYLYMGAIINTYLHPSSDGSILLFLSLITVINGIWLSYRQRCIKLKLENER